MRRIAIRDVVSPKEGVSWNGQRRGKVLELYRDARGILTAWIRWNGNALGSWPVKELRVLKNGH